MPSRQTSVYEKGKNASISDFVPDQLSKQSSGRTVSFSTSHRDPSSPKPEVDTLVFEGRRPWPKFHRKTTFSSGRVCWVDDTEISKVPGGERDQISRRCQPNEEHGKLKEANFLMVKGNGTVPPASCSFIRVLNRTPAWPSIPPAKLELRAEVGAKEEGGRIM